MIVAMMQRKSLERENNENKLSIKINWLISFFHYVKVNSGI
jgi:hypothetical protein